MFVSAMNFWDAMAKNEILDFLDTTCVSQGYFIHILYVNVDLEKFKC